MRENSVAKKAPKWVSTLEKWRDAEKDKRY